MIHLPASVRVYLCLTPCDMRKSFDSLHALVREHLELDAFAGHLFVFASRRLTSINLTSIKVLVYDGQGFWLATKRLSKGRFRWWPQGSPAPGHSR
jgi:transposase